MLLYLCSENFLESSHLENRLDIFYIIGNCLSNQFIDPGNIYVHFYAMKFETN